MSQVRGLMVAIPTPFDSQGGIDYGFVARHLAFLAEGGADGVVVCGTNGEGQSMTMDERKSMLKAVMGGRGGLSVVAGTGCASLPDTIELTRSAEEMGADAAMVIPPFLFKGPSVDGLYSYYAAVFRDTSIPVFLYNIPQVSGVEIKDELVERLLECPKLIGIKDSSGDPDRTRRYCERFRDLDIFYGADRLIECMAGLTRGGISGIANCLPELIAEAMRACDEGNGHGLQERVNELTYILDRYPLFAANKAILAMRGFPLTYVRPPLVDLTAEQCESLGRELSDGGFVQGRG